MLEAVDLIEFRWPWWGANAAGGDFLTALWGHWGRKSESHGTDEGDGTSLNFFL